MSNIAVNKRARFDYDILEELEAGIELFGFEVKAIRAGRISLSGAYVIVRDNEAWLLNASIAAYQQANTPKSYDSERTRRLLLHRSEIKKLIGKTSEMGLTIVPLRVYTMGHKIKVLIGLGRHKKKVDKRETIKKRESDREIRRTIKNR